MGDRWISDEPALSGVALRVFVRGLRRWRRVLVLASVLAAAAVGARMLKAPRHVSEVHFRLSEGGYTRPDHEPDAPRDIGQYIASVALSRQQLERMMRKHGRSVRWLDRDPIAAVNDFRQSIDIDVSWNYFMWERSERGEPRTAQVSISLTGPVEEQNRALLGEIRDAIEDEKRQRASQVEEAGSVFAAQLAAATARSAALRGEIERLGAELRRAAADDRIAIAARIASLEVQAVGALDRVVTLERAVGSARFASSAERNDVGFQLELFDERSVTFAPRLTRAELARTAAALFGLFAVLATFAIGAFDDRLHDARQLAIRGIPVFGVVPGFAGDDAGSYLARTCDR